MIFWCFSSNSTKLFSNSFVNVLVWLSVSSFNVLNVTNRGEVIYWIWTFICPIYNKFNKLFWSIFSWIL